VYPALLGGHPRVARRRLGRTELGGPRDEGADQGIEGVVVALAEGDEAGLDLEPTRGGFEQRVREPPRRSTAAGSRPL